MKRIFIVLISMLCAVLLSSCVYFEYGINNTSRNDSDVERALYKLLTCDNYTYVHMSESRFISNGVATESSGTYDSVIFHHPYKSRSFALWDPNDRGIVSGTGYEIQKNGHIELKTTHQLENGDVIERDPKVKEVYEEFFIRQMNNCLVSEELIKEHPSVKDLRKYKVVVSAYPFICFFGYVADKRDPATKIFMEVFDTCEGFVYIDGKTNDVVSIAFDLSGKKDLSKKVNDRIIKEDVTHISMGEFDKLRFSYTITSINDNSLETEEIRKEIDNEMQY